ncbi:MAG: hypothetical protein QXV17_10330 [Candidatus Micrarchaeaceae archaeon]
MNKLMGTVAISVVMFAAFTALTVLTVFQLQVQIFGANSAPSNVIANVAVGNVIYLSVSPNTINFGNLYPAGTPYDTNVLVTDNDIGGNMGANILVEGGNWIGPGTNTFGVSNTEWSPTAQTSYTGNALSTIFANTLIFIPAPTLSTSTTSNNIYFGLSIPGGTPAGVYTQNILFENYNVTYNTYNAPSTQGTVVASANVQSVCYISLTPNAINFGSIFANANVPTNNLITDSNTNGNTQATLLVYGGNWIQSANSAIQFGVSNTLWDAASQTTYNGIPLSNSLTNTGIIIPASTYNTIGSNSIYFGLGVPGGTPAGSYTQTITIENSC